MIYSNKKIEARFSERFKMKVNFPRKSELPSDIPQEEQRLDFILGRDQALEDIIRQERKEEDNSNCNSLAIVEAGILIDSESEEEEEEEETPVKKKEAAMPPSKSRLPIVKVPFKQPGQCKVSWEELKPVIGFVSAKDASMSRRKAYLSRTGLILRVDVPAGLVLVSFDPEVMPCGKQVVFTGYMDRS